MSCVPDLSVLIVGHILSITLKAIKVSHILKIIYADQFYTACLSIFHLTVLKSSKGGIH